MLLVGMGNPVYTVPVSAAALREVDLLGVFRYANTYPRGIEILCRQDSDMPDFSSLVTHHFSGFDVIQDAFEMAGKTKDGEDRLVLKVMVHAGNNGK